MHVKFHYRKIYVLSQHERMGFIPAKGLMFNSSVRLLSTLSTMCTCRQTPIDTFHKVYLSAACCRRFQHRVLFYNVYMHCFPRIRQRVLFDTVYCFRQCLLVGSRQTTATICYFVSLLYPLNRKSTPYTSAWSRLIGSRYGAQPIK